MTAIANTPGEIQLAWPANLAPGLPTVAYRIVRDGEVVGTSIGGSYVDGGLAEETDYSYQVRAVSEFGIESLDSEVVTRRSLLDTIAPKLVGSKADSKADQITLDFDKPMDPVSLTPENISISDGVTIKQITLSTDGKIVTIFTSGLSYGTILPDYLKRAYRSLLIKKYLTDQWRDIRDCLATTNHH